MECSRLRGYAARRAREEHELDLLRGRAAEAALGSGGGVGRTDTGAEDGTSKPSTGGQKGRGAARKGGKPGPRPENHDGSGAGVPQEDAANELWLDDPNFPEVLAQYQANALETKRDQDMGAQKGYPCSETVVFGGQHDCCTGIRATTGS